LEYIFRHFYLHSLYDEEGNDGRNLFYYRTTMHKFLQEFNSYTTEQTMQNRQDLCYDKVRILTKMIWRKYWLKDSNDDFSLDFDSIFNSENEAINNANAILVDQGIVVDMLDGFSNSELQQELDGEITFERSIKRVCKFYKAKQPHLKDLIQQGKYQPQEDDLIKYGSIYVSAKPNTNEERFAKIVEFFDKYEEHTFTEDNNTIVFGKGFVNFLPSRNLETNNATSYEPLFDSAYDEDQDNENGIFGLKRQLSIKLSSDQGTDRSINKNKNLKILFSDFVSEIPFNSAVNALQNPEYYCLTQGVITSVPQFMRAVANTSGYHLFFKDYWLYLLRLSDQNAFLKAHYNSFYWDSNQHLDDLPSRSSDAFKDSTEKFPRTFFTQIKIDFVNSNNNFHFACLKTLDGYQERMKKNSILINLCIYKKTPFTQDDIRRNLGPIQGFYNININYLAAKEIVNFYNPVSGELALPETHDRSIGNMYSIETNTYERFTLLSSATREGT
jgi:hypothetical protein